MYFIYLGKKEFYYIFKICCIIRALLSQECPLFHDFIFFCFFVNHALMFKYQPSHLKVKTQQ